MNFFRSATKPLWGPALSDRRPRHAIRLPPGHDRLRPADALRPGRLRNTRRACPPGQPRTNSFKKKNGRTPRGSSRQDSFKTYGTLLRAGIRRPRDTALKGIPYRVRADNFDRARGGGPRLDTPPGGAGVFFLDTGVILCSIYCVFKRAPRPRRTFYGTLYNIQNSRSASEFLTSSKRPV